MSKFELKLPQMGESVAEATLTAWLKEVGDTIELDEAVIEIATDKVDSEVPSEVEGVLIEKRFEVDDVIKVGDVVAVIETQGADEEETIFELGHDSSTNQNGSIPETAVAIEAEIEMVKEAVQQQKMEPALSFEGRFYSPLVRSIAKEEGLTDVELQNINGSGVDGRVTKDDIMDYISDRKTARVSTNQVVEEPVPSLVDNRARTFEKPLVARAVTQGISSTPNNENVAVAKKEPIDVAHGDEIIPLSRMGKLIANHMRESVATSAHVQSFVEVDVTNLVNWRNKVKQNFEQREGEKLTFTPIFIEAVAMALKKYPLMNISVEGESIIKKKRINIGMATALEDGNLIVPVIKNADQLNLVGIAKTVNDLARRARNNDLKPDEVKDGTYTVTNVGNFGSVFGTPIINQPQVGILALGVIRKMPAVIETNEGDYVGIRSKMFISHSYDHRVVNGALGGMFAKAVADYLESWDVNREI